MTTLVTGATGTVGGRLVERLREEGMPLRVASRRPGELHDRWPGIDAVELDVLRPDTIGPAVDGVTAAYYLVHSMEPSADDGFRRRDARGARAFGSAASAAGVGRVIFLGGLGDDDADLSEHLRSRHETGRILAETGPPTLEFRAAMVVGDDSASFTMLSDLVDRLPAMVLPRWVETPTQPISIDDVVDYLAAGVQVPLPPGHTIVQIGGPDVLSYRRMIEVVAAQRGKHPTIVGVPLLTPRLSSAWCGLTTSVPAAVARPLIEGMTSPTVVRDHSAAEMFPTISPTPFAEAVRRASA